MGWSNATKHYPRARRQKGNHLSIFYYFLFFLVILMLFSLCIREITDRVKRYSILYTSQLKVMQTSHDIFSESYISNYKSKCVLLGSLYERSWEGNLRSKALSWHYYTDPSGRTKIKVIYSQSANVDTISHSKFSVQLKVYLEIPG